MPVWAIASIGGVLLFLIVIEEAAHYYWKRYLHGKEEVQSPNFAALKRLVPQRVRESELVHKIIKAPVNGVSFVTMKMIKLLKADKAFVLIREKIKETGVKEKMIPLTVKGLGQLKTLLTYPFKMAKSFFSGAFTFVRKYKKSSSHS